MPITILTVPVTGISYRTLHCWILGRAEIFKKRLQLRLLSFETDIAGSHGRRIFQDVSYAFCYHSDTQYDQIPFITLGFQKSSNTIEGFRGSARSVILYCRLFITDQPILDYFHDTTDVTTPEKGEEDK